MKKILILLISLTLISNSFGEDFNQESAFDNSDSGSAFGKADDSFGGSFEEDFSESLEINGDFKIESRAFLNSDINQTVSNPNLDLELKYLKANSELKANINFNQEDKSGRLKQGYLKLFYDKFDISAGKMKLVWGKGDKVHVIDNLNSQDYTDFINEDYLDRKVGENMVKVDYYLGTGKVEMVYTPEFNGNITPNEEMWKTNEQKRLEDILKQRVFNDVFETSTGKIQEAINYLKSQGIASPTTEEILAVLESKDESLYNSFMTKINKKEDEMKSSTKVKEGQLGLRYTNSKAGYDYGISYYKGALRTPRLDSESLELIYDDVHVFGSELSTVLASINSRAELAYYFTEDTDGTDPMVQNNKAAWVLGGDRDLPISNININIQTQGEYILDKEEDELNNRIIAKISDKYKNEKILPEIQLVYNIEDKDYMLNNKLELKLKDDTSMILEYKIFNGDEDTMFGQFDKKDYGSAKFKYSF